MRIFKTGKVDEPDAITEGPLEVGACAQGKPGLANAARSHQRQQTRARECRFDLRQQASAGLRSSLDSAGSLPATARLDTGIPPV